MLENKRLSAFVVFFGLCALSGLWTLAQAFGAEKPEPDILIEAKPEEQIVCLCDQASVAFTQDFNDKKLGVKEEIKLDADEVTQTIVLSFGGPDDEGQITVF